MESPCLGIVVTSGPCVKIPFINYIISKMVTGNNFKAECSYVIYE
jgi:hypothetical protein